MKLETPSLPKQSFKCEGPLTYEDTHTGGQSPRAAKHPDNQWQEKTGSDSPVRPQAGAWKKCLLPAHSRDSNQQLRGRARFSRHQAVLDPVKTKSAHAHGLRELAAMFYSISKVGKTEAEKFDMARKRS